MFDHPDFDGHERIVHAFDAASGLRAIVAIHSTALGPSFGGCRMWPYASIAVAERDVLRLSRAMTFKSAICGLPYGGGKSVILGNSRTQKTPALLEAMGRLVESLGGRYIVADDVGTTLDDLAAMRRHTRNTAATTAAAQTALPVTAYGVLHAIEAAARVVLGRHAGLTGVSVAVQGLGNVGGPLARLLTEQGASVVVADIDAARADALARDIGATPMPAENVYDAKADIFAPCALGGVINAATVPRLNVRVVCGGANNQLDLPEMAEALARRGIVYVPDYLAGAGGVIDFHQESIDDSADAVLAAVGRIGDITADLVTDAVRSGRTPAEVGGERVARALAAARARTS